MNSYIAFLEAMDMPVESSVDVAGWTFMLAVFALLVLAVLALSLWGIGAAFNNAANCWGRLASRIRESIRYRSKVTLCYLSGQWEDAQKVQRPYRRY